MSSHVLSGDSQIVEVNPVVGRDLWMAIHAELEKVLEVVVHVEAKESSACAQQRAAQRRCPGRPLAKQRW